MCTFDEICNVGNIPMLREEAALDICAWKAEHEDVYAEFKKKMDNISVGDMSALESMFDLVCDCLPDELAEDDNHSLPGYGSPDDIWQNLSQYAKSYIADACKEDGKTASKENCLSLIGEATEYMDTCMSVVPEFLCNLRNKTIDEGNDLIRCMYYYMRYDGGSTKMMGTLNDIMNNEVLDQEDMAMIHSCVSSLVPGSIELGVETKESWTDAVAKCNPEIWKDVTYELSKSEGNRGRKAEIVCIDNLLKGNKVAIKQQILRFLDENPEPICLAYLLKSLIRAGAIKRNVNYTTFHRAIEHLTGRMIGIDSPQKRFGELKSFGLQGPQKGCWAKAKAIIANWTEIFEKVK